MNDTFTAAQVWDSGTQNGVCYNCDSYVGTFTAYVGKVYFNCGEEDCCQWDYDSRKEFVDYHNQHGHKFTLK